MEPLMRYRPWILALLVLLPVAAHAQAPAAPAASPADDRSTLAKTFYEEGMSHFQLDEWDLAIESWQSGFRAKPAPQFLYNIAQAYRLSKRPDQALSFYKKYLHLAPKAPNRLEVERHIEALTKLVEAENRNSTRPPVQPLEVKPPPGGEPAGTTPAPAPVVQT